MNNFNFKHSGRLGDIIYSLAFVKEICRKNNVKANYYILNDCFIDVKKSAFHPGNGIMVSQQLYDYICPLLVEQDYINEVIYCSSTQTPTEIVDLDLFKSSDSNLKAGLIQGWYRKTFATPVPIELPWLSAPSASDKNHYDILINKSTRFYNKKINYRFLDDFLNAGFVGLAYEYEDFITRHQLKNLPYIKTNSALALAEKLTQCKLFIGNQSMPFAIAEALKINRALDVYEPVPNVIPVGGLCVDFNNTQQITHFINDFFEKNLAVNNDFKNNQDYVESILNEKSSSLKKLKKLFKIF